MFIKSIIHVHRTYSLLPTPYCLLMKPFTLWIRGMYRDCGNYATICRIEVAKSESRTCKSGE